MAISMNSTYFGISSDSVSTLFGSVSTGKNNVATGSILADYASIRNGSYTKLMKAYYNENSSINRMENKTSYDKADKNNATALKDASKALGNSAKALWESDDKSVFAKDAAGNYDVDGIYKAVSSFVKDYNNTVEHAGDSNSNTVLKAGTNMVSLTKTMSASLSRLGISVGSDNTLSIDEEAFKKSNMTEAKALFNGAGSYTYQVSSAASRIANGSITQLANMSGGFYNSTGAYSGFDTGSLYAGLF